MQLLERPPVLVLGFSIRTDNATESDPARGVIGPTWGRLMGALGSLPKREEAGRLASVYREYESDHTGAYSLVIGAVVTSLDEVPEGMVGVEVPGATALRYEAAGEMPAALIETWMRIWGEFPANGFERAFGLDLELHDASGDRAEIWIDARPVGSGA